MIGIKNNNGFFRISVAVIMVFSVCGREVGGPPPPPP